MTVIGRRVTVYREGTEVVLEVRAWPSALATGLSPDEARQVADALVQEAGPLEASLEEAADWAFIRHAAKSSAHACLHLADSMEVRAAWQRRINLIEAWRPGTRPPA